MSLKIKDGFKIKPPKAKGGREKEYESVIKVTGDLSLKSNMHSLLCCNMVVSKINNLA